MFRRRLAEPTAPAKDSARAPVPGAACGSLSRALERVFREPKAEILHLGPMCGETVVYLAGRGARVAVEEFVPPAPTPPRKPGEIFVDTEPLQFDQPDGKFHLVLAWELTDFVPPDRLADYGAELRRVVRDGGWLFLLSLAQPGVAREPLVRYRLLAGERIARETCEESPRLRRFAHPTREIERALAGFSIQGIQLQRNQMREILALKVGVGS